jgi:hypothetical protein
MDHSAADPRRSPRAKVFLAATLECADGILPVTLRDLSEHGALIESECGLTLDCEVWFCRNELRVHGYVAWVEDKQAGIAFSRALKAEVVLRHINRPAARPVDETTHRRPALTRPGMSAEEQRWADEILREPVRHRRIK